MKRIIAISFLFISLHASSQPTFTNVKNYGITGDGVTLCSAAINHLIDSIAAEGGGTLFFPAGNYFTGPIFLKSNITLYLDAGARIKFSDNFDDYLPMVPSRWEDVRVKTFASPIYAYQCENIAIRGDGHIEGQGKKWWDFWNHSKTGSPVDTKWQKTFREENAELLQKNAYIRDKNAFLRPSMVTVYECKNVLIEGVSFSNPPFWTIMPTFSDNITIEGITIDNPDYSPNTDGIDLSSCTNVHISNSHITVGDDCIVIKSGRDEDGREAARPTENLVITNCTMLKGHGGVVIGSEMSGNVKRVAISNCVFEGTDVGIRIKTMRGRGGIVEDIQVSNIVMYDMVKEGVIITMRYQPSPEEPVSERTPTVRNVHLANVTMHNANRAIAIYGLPEREIEQISFSNFHITSKKGIIVENASDVSFSDIRILCSEGIPFEAYNSKVLQYNQVQVAATAFDKPPLKLSNCSEVRITNCYQPEAIPVFVNEDEKCSGIFLMNNLLPNTSALYSKKGKQVVAENNILKQK